MDTIPLEKEFINAVEDIAGFLREKKYFKVEQLPYSKGNISSIVNDLVFFIRGKGGIFKSSFLYGLRRRIFSDQELVILSDFFVHNKEVASSKICRILGEERVRGLLRLNILSEGLPAKSDKLLRSQMRIIPFQGEYFVSDPFDRRIRDFVWIGSDSISLASRLKRLNHNGRVAIDIGSGSGIQSISLASRAGAGVIGVDINEKGLRYGRLNAIINKKANIRFVRSDMLSAIKGGVDIIVSNPPFIYLPPSERAVNRDGYGGAFGLDKIIYILERIPEYLNPGGMAILLTLSPVISGKDILIEEVKKIFHKNYAIDYRILDYVYMNGAKRLYDSENISYFVQGILEVSKDESRPDARIKIKGIPIAKSALSLVKIAVKKAFYKECAYDAAQ